MKNTSATSFLLSLLAAFVAMPLLAQEPPQVPSAPERVKGAHEDQAADARQDDLGITVPIPTSHPGRRYPSDHDFPTGPAVGERLPEFQLPNQDGEVVDFHADRGDGKAIVVFYRSAVW